MRENNPVRIFVHTTDADYESIPNQFFPVNSWHKDKYGDYCLSSMGYYGGYTLLITNGKEFRYREDFEETCAVKGYNTSSLSIAIGFDGDIQMPKPKDVKLLRKRLIKWCAKYNIPMDSVNFVGPHRTVNVGKTCYGSLLPDDWAVNLMKEINKDPASVEKKIEIEKRKQVLINTIRQLVLELKILVGKYTILVNKRKNKYE